jgi:hypothetical protein
MVIVSTTVKSYTDTADAATRPMIREADATGATNLPIPMTADLIASHATTLADVADVNAPISALERDAGEKSEPPSALRTDAADVITHPSADRADVNGPLSVASPLPAERNLLVSAVGAETADASQSRSPRYANVHVSLSAEKNSRADGITLASAEGAEMADASRWSSAIAALCPEGDLLTSAEKVDVAESANVNVTILSFLEKNTNVNVHLVADFLCQLFGESASKQGIYAKLIRQGCDQPEAICAAALYALVHFHRDGTIDNPAAFFIARCKCFHQAGIPPEAAEVLAQYGHLTTQQFQEALRQPVPPSARRQSGLERITPLTAPHPVHKEVACPFPILKAQIPLASEAGMSQQEAAHLCWEVNQEFGIRECRCGLLALPDQTYAVLIDAGKHEGAPRQVALYSRAQWQQEREDISVRLFDQSASTKVRECFRQQVQQRRRQRWIERLNP